MYNWSTVEEALRSDPEQHAIWRLEQLINFGLDGEKINLADLRKYFSRLNIDPHRRRFISLLIDEGKNP